MNKKFLKIFLIVLFSFILVSPLVYSGVVKADIGFDGDYDSGSDWGGGYDSWYDDDDEDDDYYYYGSDYGNSNYSGEPLTFKGWMMVLLVVGGSFIIPLGIYILVTRSSSKGPRGGGYPVSTLGMSVDEDLNMQVYMMYKSLNDAWMNKNLEPVRHLLTDELYNMYLMQLDTLIENGQTNIMKDYLFVSGHIASRRKYKGKETVVMIFRVKCRDYIVNSNNKVVRGNSRDVMDYTYEFKLVRNVVDKQIICPSCGANIATKDGVVCSHCGTVVNTSTGEFRLADKKIIYQSKIRR